ncbi:unnamed protein product [Rotaria socialis]|nr:unnamed protein product [Rotaria socialis]
MSRSDLCSMARIIDPKNIISVTLSDEIQTPGQIRLFLTHFQIDQFIRLRSLTLVKANATMPYVFPNVTELKIVINEKWSASLGKHLYKIVTLWNLGTLWLDFQCECMSTVNLSVEMNTLLKLASNIRSLRISCNKSERMKMVTFNAICLTLPHHIKRLDADIMHVADAKTLLEQAQHLKSVTFRTIDPWYFAHEIDLWLWQMKRNTVVYQVDAIRLRRYDDFESNNAIHLWLGKDVNQQSSSSHSHKRIKLC